MDLLTAFGAKRRRRKRSPKRKKRKTTMILGRIMIKKRKKTLYKGKNGGVYYRTKGARVYVNMKKLKRKGRLYMLRKKKKKSSRKRGRKTRFGMLY